MKPRIAFVVHRYAKEVTGGSENHCREVAERMQKWYDVEVLTTCAIDHLSWKNFFPEGETSVNGVPVRRYPTTEERHLLNFHKIYDRIFVEQLSIDQEWEMLRYQGPYCPDLISWLKRNQSRYDAVIFFTYLYYPVIAGMPLCKEKAVFVPTAHDEASLYLHVLDELFHLTPHIMFNSEEERLLLQRRFSLPSHVGRIVGMGIDEPQPGDPHVSWEDLRPRITGRHVLTYVGRVENGKGCDELVENFLRFTEDEDRGDVLLLLLGNRTLPLPSSRQILSPGYVPEFVKYHALKHTTVAVAPSPLESLCIAALESWMHRLPLLVNGRCPVLAGHCVRSNGGLWYTSYPEFREALKMLLDDAPLRSVLGNQGRSYVESFFRWDVVEHAYRDVLETVINGRTAAAGVP